MAAAHVNFGKKKHGERHIIDEGSGMSMGTKKHFDHVKRKLFAFLDRKERMELDQMQGAPTPRIRRGVPRASTPLPPMFPDERKGLKPPPSHHRTPASPRKHLVPAPAQEQLPHLALATPQIAHRLKIRQGSNMHHRSNANLSPF